MNKEELLAHITQLVQDKIKGIEDQFDALNESLQSASKSSAGDKHETSRAMVHLEQEQLSKQLTVLKTQQEGIEKLKQIKSGSDIQYGSLVETNNGFYLIGIGIGVIEFNNNTIYCLSGTAPIVNQFNGKTIGDQIQIGPNKIEIKNIL